MLQNAVDVGAEGVRQFAGEIARIDLADDSREHKEAEEAEFMRPTQGCSEFRKVAGHRAADIEVDMGDRKRSPLNPLFFQDAPVNDRPCPVEGFPRGNPAVAGLGNDRFDGPYGLHQCRTECRAPAQGMDACLAQDFFKSPAQRVGRCGCGFELVALGGRSLVTPRENAVRARPLAHNIADCLSEEGIAFCKVRVICVVADEDAIVCSIAFERFDEEFKNLEVGGAYCGIPIEKLDDALFFFGGVGWNAQTVRPAHRRSQQAGRKILGAVDSREERPVALLAELLAENRIDDGVERDVVGAGRALEQAGMAEHDMVEFVQHEHEEVLVGAAMVGDEAWI